MDADRARLIRRLASEAEEELVTWLSRLIQVPSPNPPGEYGPIAEAVATLLRSLEYQVSIIDAPDAEVQKADLISPRRNVLGELGGSLSGGPTIILNAHLDTVPVVSPDQWTHPPFAGAVANDRVWGRGAVDSKARMVSYAIAPHLLRRAGIQTQGSVLCAFTCDEETGGELGAGYLTRTRQLWGDGAIVEGYNSPIIRAAAGLLWVDIEIQGKAAHASRPDLGVNAIEPLADLIPGLLQLQRRLALQTSRVPGLGHSTLNLGVIHGGVKSNVVPDRCRMSIDCRVIPEVEPDQVLSEIRTIAQDVQDRFPGVRIFVENVRKHPATSLPEDHPMVTTLVNACQQILGKRVPIQGETGGTDAKWFNAVGIPSVNYGPGRMESGNYHGVDEHVNIADLVEATAVLATFLADFLAPQGKPVEVRR